MSHKTEHVGHWEGLEMWLSVTTDSILPKAAEALRHQTQDQLDDNITSIMRQEPSQNYNHKELAKITGSLSHTLIATLKLSDKHTAQHQQELTSAQRRIEQLEREAQERQEGTDEVEQGAEEEINRLKETLAATSHEIQQIKEDFADHADKLQYAEKLLDKAKTDFRDKNSRIKALEAHRHSQTEWQTYRLVEPLIIKPIKMTQLSVMLNNASLCLLKFLTCSFPNYPAPGFSQW